QVPAGQWTIMRFGFTTSGAHVSTSSGKWKGRVIDYMSARSFNRYWDSHVEPLLEMIGPLAGTTLRYLQTDSWELGGINWSDDFALEFQRRRGYALYKYLPVIGGKIIDSRSRSNAFLADFRKTIGECIAENHYKVFAERAKKFRLGIQSESAGPHAAPIDGLKNYGYSELMMSEFWSPSPHRSRDEDRFFVKQAASAAQIYGRRLVGAESFTTIGRHWNDVPWQTMKPPFDREACSGLNLVFLHTFTCSPVEMGKPGQEYFAGTHLNRNITWWDFAGEVFDYFKRCQYLLQRGYVATEVLYYYGDHVPNIGHLKAFDPARVLPGYDYDLINEDRLLALEFREGLIRLPHGHGYKLLVLPAHGVMSLAALRKVNQLVNAGALVLGPRPRLVSLAGGQAAADEFNRSVTDLWGPSDIPKGERTSGKGKIFWGSTGEEVLAKIAMPADVIIEKSRSSDAFDFIHRREPGMDIYFVSSQNPAQTSASFSFRIDDRMPELFDALTGRVATPLKWRIDNSRTFVDLDFEPYGSVFVVFRKRTGTRSASGSTTRTVVSTLSGNWRMQFHFQEALVDITTDSLESWTRQSLAAFKFHSGKVTYSLQFNFPQFEEGQNYFVTLNDIRDVGIARVTLNGRPVGITWTPPFRLAVSNELRRKRNKIEIEVINSWRNRLVGDRGLPKRDRQTETNITIRPDWSVLDAGLIGPVQIEKQTGQR
ncbi:MAG TPA: glycosyl hydrolase, partial [Chryseosolibacter sp.]|nr:glycosyl hydrolase [Chryseosolibacter sp.]